MPLRNECSASAGCWQPGMGAEKETVVHFMMCTRPPPRMWHMIRGATLLVSVCCRVLRGSVHRWWLPYYIIFIVCVFVTTNTVVCEIL